MEETGSELYLNTSELLNENRRQQESVTDMYGIDVFTNEYKSLQNEIKEKQDAVDRELTQMIFTEEITVSTNNVTGLLFLETHNYFSGENTSVVYDNEMGYTFVWITAILIIWGLILGRKKGRKKHERYNTTERNRERNEC